MLSESVVDELRDAGNRSARLLRESPTYEHGIAHVRAVPLTLSNGVTVGIAEPADSPVPALSAGLAPALIDGAGIADDLAARIRDYYRNRAKLVPPLPWSPPRVGRTALGPVILN